MKPLLMEDDCAPDAYEYFCKKFEEITGTTVTEFKASALDLSGHDYHRWVNNNYRLEYHAGGPFHVLYEVGK